MIDEKFYQAAINIRKTYIRLTSDIESYKSMMESSLKKLTRSIVDIENLQKELKESRKKGKDYENNMNSVEVLNRVINDVEEEGIRIERFIDPINKDIEKLAEEEQMLYRSICEAHPNLTESQIVSAVRNRLIKENLD